MSVAARARLGLLLSLSLVFLAGCGSEDAAGPGSPLPVTLTPDVGLLTAVGGTVQFSATVPGGSGGVTWTSSDPEVATVDAEGRATAVAPGSVEIRATEPRGGFAVALLEVWLPATVERYLPGVRYEGRRGYVEYVPGTLPLVLAAPHGGARIPEEIPDRTVGTTVTDRNTSELAEAVADALQDRTGDRPHLVLSRLDRAKLDPNRELNEAAQGNPFAEHAWKEYHDFIGMASDSIEARHGEGLFVDIHGHGHEVPRVELGYLLDASALAQDDDILDGLAGSSSIRALVERWSTPLSVLVRGPGSLGSLLEDAGAAAVPSDVVPGPGGDPFFSGGYSTAVHGSRDGGTVSAVQLEHPYAGFRDTPENRDTYAGILAAVLLEFLDRRGAAPDSPLVLEAPGS